MKHHRFPGFPKPASLLCALALAVFLAASASTLTQTAAAQPSPSDLADRLEQAHQERIRQVERVQITNRITAGMFDGEETVTVLVKTQREGKYVLTPVESDDLYADDDLSGFSDELFSRMIRRASAIENETWEGHRVYRITVDDADFLRSLDALDPLEDPFFDEFDEYAESGDEADGESVPEKVTLWLDRSELLTRGVAMAFPGEGITVTYRFNDYQTFSGLPVPMVTEVHIEGLEELISDEELAEARQAMQQLEAQLEQMPEAQRDMIRQQIQPQIERLEQMLESGDIGKARVEVVDVVVN